jgi:hypothetical protein
MNRRVFQQLSQQLKADLQKKENVRQEKVFYVMIDNNHSGHETGPVSVIFHAGGDYYCHSLLQFLNELSKIDTARG